MFSTLEVVGVSEMSLGANQWKEDMKRMKWKLNKSTHTHTDITDMTIFIRIRNVFYISYTQYYYSINTLSVIKGI